MVAVCNTHASVHTNLEVAVYDVIAVEILEHRHHASPVKLPSGRVTAPVLSTVVDAAKSHGAREWNLVPKRHQRVVLFRSFYSRCEEPALPRW